MNPENIKNKVKRIKWIIMDVDGVLTSGQIMMLNEIEIKIFNVYDGLGITLAHKAGLKTAIISGRESPAVTKRAEELGIKEVHQGCKDKLQTLDLIRKKYDISYDEIAYMGDDLPDISVMKKAGLSIAVANAVDEVKESADLVTVKKGGDGAVREVIEIILKHKDKIG